MLNTTKEFSWELAWAIKIKMGGKIEENLNHKEGLVEILKKIEIN